VNEAANEESLPTSDARSFEQYVDEYGARIRGIVDEYRQKFRYVTSCNTISHSVC